MSRYYTDEEKRLVLDRLIANHGDVARTVTETNVPMRTIYNWQKDANLALPKLLPNLPTDSSSPRPEGDGPGVRVDDLPAETTEAFQILHDKLLAIADTLSNRIVEAIDDAPLNQRMTALSQLIDRIAKLATLLPKEEIEYVYEYELEHHVEKKDDEEDSEAETED